MDTFSLCVQAVFPLLAFLLLGYILRLAAIVSERGFADLRRLAVSVLIPFTNFQSIRHADFFSIFPVSAIFLGCTLTLLVFLLASFAAPRLAGPAAAPTLVHGIMHPNMSIIGIPLAKQLLGEERLPAFVILLSFLCIVLSGLMVINHQRYARTNVSLPRTILGIFTTPILVGALLGMLFSLLPFQFPALAESIFSAFSGACGPVCLIALGGSFSFRELSPRPVLIACLGRLVVFPAIVLLSSLALALPAEQTVLLMLAFVCPTALLCQIMSETVSGDPKLGSQIVVYTSVLSIPTIFFWLYLTLSLLRL